MPDWTGWIEIGLESALLAIAFVAVFEGARRLAFRGPTRGAALMLAVALAIPAYEGWASLRLSRTLQLLAHQPAGMQAAEPPGGWEKAPLSPAERTAASTNAASLNFRLTGQRGQVIDADGNRIRFQPTDDDLAGRDSLVHGQKGTEDAANQFLERGVRLMTNAAVFLLVGVLVGVFQRRRAGPAAAAR